jgi:enoyl-CoA hydratase/carnithine racemase
VRVVGAAANGPAFSAGHDMKEMTARRSDADRGPRLLQAADGCVRDDDAGDRASAEAGDRRVQGAASAAGCQLVASCDLAVASSAAKFATPGVNIGLFCSTPMVALSRNVVAQARDGNAADRRHDLGRGRAAHRARQSRGRAGPSATKR